MSPLTYDATVRRDVARGQGYLAVSTARHIGTAIVTDWAWTGYGDTPEDALADLERQLGQLYKEAVQPRRIVYELEP